MWGYGLRPHHVQVSALPQTADGGRQAMGATHRRYTRRIAAWEGWRGEV